MSDRFKHGDLSVYELPGAELRGMILEHADSLAACYAKIWVALQALPPEPADMPETEMGERRSVMYQKNMERVKYYEEEARFLAAHVPMDKAFMLNGTQLTAFKTSWRATDIDLEKMSWAPAAGKEPNDQAERSLARTVTATPRIVMPDGTMSFSGR